MLESSILSSTKKVLGLPASLTEFDEDVLQHINTAFATLWDLGVLDTYTLVEDVDDEWVDLGFDVPTMSMIKTYTYLRVRMLFDPPSTSFGLEAAKDQIKELEYRLNSQREVTAYEAQLAAEESES